MDFIIWLLFGNVIIAVFIIVLTIACFNVLADLIGFPTESVSHIVNMVTHYFWPALLAGGLLSGATKKVRTSLMCVAVWLLILVLFCFVPGNITLPDAEKVARMEITYAYDIFEVDKKVSYDYKGFSVKDPAVIEQVITMLDDAKYTHTHKEVLTKDDPLYDRVMIKFKDAEGDTLKELTMINSQGIRVEGFMMDRYYRARKNKGFDAEMINYIAHNGKL